MGIVVYSFIWAMQDLFHQQYAAAWTLWESPRNSQLKPSDSCVLRAELAEQALGFGF